MDDNFHSEINMEENHQNYKKQQDDFQVFFSTIQINEFDKKITHNNILTFPYENLENSFPTYSKLGNSNAKFELMDSIYEKKNNNLNNNQTSNKNDDFNIEYPDFNRNSETIFSDIYEENHNFYNNANSNNIVNAINDFSINKDLVNENNENNNRIQYEKFQIFDKSEEQEMKTFNNENIKNNYINTQNAVNNRRFSDENVNFDNKQVFSINNISNYNIREKEEKKDL